MDSIARLLQLAGLVIVGIGALAPFWTDMRESTMWLLWGGGGLVFLAGRAIERPPGR